MNTDKCPCCLKPISQRTLNTPYQANGRPVYGVHECPHCKAVFGTCYLGESYGIVLSYMTSANVPMDQTRYYDFETLGSDGIGRRHGWFDPATRLIVQVG